jgi:transcriptional regulator with XRE-family HTH domain
MPASALADRLAISRNSRSMTQEQLSERSGVPQPQISRIERGAVSEPAFSTVAALARTLEVTLEALSAPGIEQLLRELAGPPRRQGPHIGLSSLTGTPVWARSLDGPEPESLFICGGLGAGISYTAKLECLRALAAGHKVTFIDPKGEYTSFVERLGGLVVPLGCPDGPQLSPLGAAQLTLRPSLTERWEWVVRWARGLAEEDLSTEAQDALTKALVCLHARGDVPSPGKGPSVADLLAILGPMGSGAAAEAAAALSEAVGAQGPETILPEARVESLDLSSVPSKGARGALALLALMRSCARGPRLVVVDLDAFRAERSRWAQPERWESALEEMRAARTRGVAFTLLCEDEALEAFEEQPKSGFLALCESSLILRVGRRWTRAVSYAFDLSQAEGQRLMRAEPGCGLLLRTDSDGWVRVVGTATEDEQALIGEPSSSVFDVIRERVPLRDYLANHLGVECGPGGHAKRCPFHDDDSPSFLIHEPSGRQWETWSCMGACHQDGGTVLDAVMRAEGLDVLGAVQLLDGLYGLGLGEAS